MKQQMWTLKQVLFEREMVYKDSSLYINGFKLPKDKDLLLNVLNELYKEYDDRRKELNEKEIDYYILHGTKFTEIWLPGLYCLKPTNQVCLLARGKDYYPEDQGLYYVNGRHNKKGLHIHRSRLLISKQEGDNQSGN